MADENKSKVYDTGTDAGAEEGRIMSLMIGDGDKAIRAQEARGQRSLVNSTQLPVQGSEDETFAEMGIVFGFGPIVEGEIFRDAELPEGWSKQGTDHPMWSALKDQNGSVRALIFYKAAFYDRSAHMRPERRFSISSDYDYEKANPGKSRVCVYDAWGGEKANVFQVDKDCPDDEDKWNVYDQMRAPCVAWLDEHYPQWRSFGAYWDAK